ncbi:MurR/RpiR family transcriptional regulator [Kitasatospora herbaricolor]|uniref:MurR/RpiR family transcriptional regulator n=1 Tax=Kitasatospora herbaricolor TaxID=68217 RepID=A0ABZ1WIM5_9ACTN|nr:MurR/RpiR family transcriptional regulator [Kitasatospora herbaricolor]
MASPTLAEDIRQRLGDCSPAERKVGRVLLAGWPAAGFETIATLAERADVSAPTVLRFVTRLGYRGFPDFQTALRAELDERHASPLTLYTAGGYGAAAADGAAGADAGPAALLGRGREVFTTAVDRTLAEVPPHDLERAVQLLSDPKRHITLAGGRFTHLLAQYLGLHLMQLRDEVRFLPDRPVERTAHLASMGRRDVLVVFDYRRYEDDKVTMAELVRDAGGRVVLFTDTWLSPVSTQAEVVLSSQVGAPSPYDSLVPTLAVVETVVAGVITALGESAHQHMQRGEETAKRAGLT